MYPAGLERQHAHDPFDPLTEGARYGLSRERLLAIWERVCADATDRAGRRDMGQARRQFHQLATRLAGRDGRLRSDVGRLTRVEVELEGAAPLVSVDELTIRTPGRETLVAAEARRTASMTDERVGAVETTRAIRGSEQGNATSELPGANEGVVAMSGLQHPVQPEPARPLSASVRMPTRRLFDIDLAAWRPPGYERDPRGAWLPAAMLELPRRGTAPVAIQRKTSSASSHDEAEIGGLLEPTEAGQPLPETLRRKMERVLGADFSAVRIHEGPQAEAIGALAYTRGTDIYFAPGQYDPDSQRGQTLLGHELAHVVQQAQGRVHPTAHASGVAVNDSSSLEREADDLGARAALAPRELLPHRHVPHEGSGELDGRVPDPEVSHGSADGHTRVSAATGADVAQMQPSGAPRAADPPAGTRSVQRGQVLARLLDEWRAAGLLDRPARPADVGEFSPIAPPRSGSMRASEGGAAIAGAAPALRPGPAPAPSPVRPPLRLIPGGGGAPVAAPEPVPTPVISPALLGFAVFVIVLLWPNETAPPWMDELNPITGGPYGSPEEYDWTRRLSPQQQDYLRRLAREHPTGQAPRPKPDGQTAPTPAPHAPPVPILDTADEKRDEQLPAVDFYHGTDKQTAQEMTAGKRIVASGRGEFGKGFYTFFVEAAAAEAAQIYTRNRNQGFRSWGVVDFAVPATTLAAFFEASTVAAFLQHKLSRILVFPDKTATVKVTHPVELGGIDLALTWTEFVETNAKAGKNVAWPYDLIIGPLKGKLRSQKSGVDQWVFGDDGAMVFNSPTVKRKMSSLGDL